MNSKFKWFTGLELKYAQKVEKHLLRVLGIQAMGSFTSL